MLATSIPATLPAKIGWTFGGLLYDFSMAVVSGIVTAMLLGIAMKMWNKKLDAKLHASVIASLEDVGTVWESDTTGVEITNSLSREMFIREVTLLWESKTGQVRAITIPSGGAAGLQSYDDGTASNWNQLWARLPPLTSGRWSIANHRIRNEMGDGQFTGMKIRVEYLNRFQESRVFTHRFDGGMAIGQLNLVIDRPTPMEGIGGE